MASVAAPGQAHGMFCGECANRVVALDPGRGDERPRIHGFRAAAGPVVNAKRWV